MDNEYEKARHEVEQMARELAPETTKAEFLEAFGMGATCERCGRKELDDDDYTDCDIIPGPPTDPEAPPVLVCHECVSPEKARALWQARND